MNATILIDNKTQTAPHCEWGLSVYIETDGKKILLDTGKSGVFADNAEALGIDLQDVDIGVLSHAHYDHANGLERFFSVNSKAKFYLCKNTEENCYRRILFFYKYIGIKKGTLEKYKDRFVYADGDTEIAPGVWLIPHKTEGLEKKGIAAKMYRKTAHGRVPDNFDHEQSLVIDSEKGLYIFNSCSHGGADNIIDEIKNTFPGKKIYAMVGGFHLFGSSDEYVTDFANRLKETGVEKIITGHCTGDRAFAILRSVLKDKAVQMYSGLKF